MKVEVTGIDKKTKPPLGLTSKKWDVVDPNECVMFPTGVAVSMESPKMMGVLYCPDFQLANTIGIIDSDFHGEIRCGIFNQEKTPIIIRLNQRIGELFFMPIIDKDVEIIPVKDGIVLPAYATPGAAGLDIFANVSVPITFYPDETLRIATGFKVEIHKPNIIGLIVSRSGLSVNHSIMLANSIEIVQSSYQEEITVKLVNHGKRPYTINPMDKIAQMIFIPIITPNLVKVKEFSTVTTRSNQGFGSTGK